MKKHEVRISSSSDHNTRMKRNLYTYPEFRKVLPLFIRSAGYKISTALKKYNLRESTYNTLVYSRDGEASVKPLVNLLRNMGYTVTLMIHVDRRTVASGNVRKFIHKKIENQKAENTKNVRFSRRSISDET